MSQVSRLSSFIAELKRRRDRALAALGRQYESLEAYRELLELLQVAGQDFPHLIAARSKLLCACDPLDSKPQFLWIGPKSR